MTLVRKTQFAWLLLAVLTAPLQAKSPEARRLQMVDGLASSAMLVGIADQGTLRLQAEDTERLVPLEELVVWGAPAEAQRAPLVLTVHGGIIVASDPTILGPVVRIERRQVQIETDALAMLTFARQQVQAVVFQLPADLPGQDRLLRRLADWQDDKDQLLLSNGDVLSGADLELADDVVRMTTSTGPLEVELAQLMAIRLGHVKRSASADDLPKVMIGLRNGTQLPAESVAGTGNTLQVKLAEGGQTLTRLAVSEVVLVQPIGNRPEYHYLSDLSPLSYRHVPYWTVVWPLVADRNVLGNRLRCRGRGYLKGLGMHSAARVAYRLDEPFTRFDAELAIDDSAAGKGSVVFRVYLNRDGKWSEAYRSPVVRGGDAALPVSVDLTGAQGITLMVEFAERGDELDHANWLGARLVR